MFGYGQYLNELLVTPNKNEYPSSFHVKELDEDLNY